MYNYDTADYVQPSMLTCALLVSGARLSVRVGPHAVLTVIGRGRIGTRTGPCPLHACAITPCRPRRPPAIH
jgi:hypothetical protein